jgi:hypothetical protein
MENSESEFVTSWFKFLQISQTARPAITPVFIARTFKRVWGPGIDSKDWIPPAYVAWRAGTITLFLLDS